MLRANRRAIVMMATLDADERHDGRLRARVGANVLRELDGLLATFIDEVSRWLQPRAAQAARPASTTLRRLDLPLADSLGHRLALVHVGLQRRRLSRTEDRQAQAALNGTAIGLLYAAIVDEVLALAWRRLDADAATAQLGVTLTRTSIATKSSAAPL